MYSFALESPRGRRNAGHRNVTAMQSHFCDNRAAPEGPYFYWILLQTGSAFVGWKRRWTFAGLVPFYTLFCWDSEILGCCPGVTLRVLSVLSRVSTTALQPQLHQLALQAWRWNEDECAHPRQMVSPSLAVVFEREFLHVISAAQKEMKVFLTVNTFFSLPSSALLWVSEDSLHCFSQRCLFLSHLRSIWACPMHIW